MKFALLGIDDESLRLTEAALCAGYELVWCGDIAVKDGISPDFLLEDQGDLWEVLYDRSLCDAVIVGRGNCTPSLRCEQLIQLSKSGVAALVTFPLCDSVLSFYEIDMARNESDAVLHHFNPLVEQRVEIEQCATWVREGHPQLGAVEQVVWERPLGTRTREKVLWHFARDVELLSQVAGKLDRLGALGSPDERATYSGLSVQLLGKSQVPVRWSVGPVEQSECPRLTLIAEQGKVVVDFSERGQITQIETWHQGSSNILALEEVPEISPALQRFAAAVEASEGKSSTWGVALRAMELTDTIEISLRRGRMIDVHPQQLTEQLAFKGMMSALSCGVLVVLVPLLLTLGWIAEIVGIPVAKYWPHVLLPLLVLFLVVQILPKLFMDIGGTDSESNGTPSGDR